MRRADVLTAPERRHPPTPFDRSDDAARPIEGPSATGRPVAWLIAATIPAVFLAVDPDGWYPFGPIKVLVASVAVLTAAAGAGWAGWLRWQTRTDRWWALLLVTFSGAAAIGLDGRYAWLGTPERRLGALAWLLFAIAFVIGRSVPPDLLRRPLETAAVVAGLGVGGVASAQALGWRPGPLGLGGERLGATFGTPACLGGATALLLPMLVGLSVNPAGASGKIRRVAAGSAVVILTVAAVGSGSRGAWLGLAVSAGVVVASRGRSWWRRSRSQVVAGTAAVVIGLAVVATVGPMGQRLTGLGDRDAAGGTARLDEWRVALHVVASHPLTGVGPEGYRIAFGGAVDAEYERTHGRDPQPDRAHSSPLDVAVTGGLVALVAWAGLLVAVGRPILQLARRGPPAAAGMAAGLIAFAVSELVLFPTIELDVVAWLLAGATLARAGAVSTDRRPPAQHAPSSLTPHPGRTTRVLAAVFAMAAFAALVAGLTEMAADRRAEDAVRFAGRGRSAEALASAESAVAARPDIVRLHLLVADLRLADGRGYAAALDAVDAAAAWSPTDPIVARRRTELLVGRAAATGVPAHVQAAAVAVERLLETDPNLAAAHLLAGDVADLDHDRAKAAQRWRRAADLGPRDPTAPIRLARLALAADDLPEARHWTQVSQSRSPESPDVRALLREMTP